MVETERVKHERRRIVGRVGSAVAEREPGQLELARAETNQRLDGRLLRRVSVKRLLRQGHGRCDRCGIIRIQRAARPAQGTFHDRTPDNDTARRLRHCSVCAWPRCCSPGARPFRPHAAHPGEGDPPAHPAATAGAVIDRPGRQAADDGFFPRPAGPSRFSVSRVARTSARRHFRCWPRSRSNWQRCHRPHNRACCWSVSIRSTTRPNCSRAT